jgi:hypothetical protein
MKNEANKVADELINEIKITLNKFLYTQITPSNIDAIHIAVNQTVRNICFRNKLGIFETEIISKLLVSLLNIQ